MLVSEMVIHNASSVALAIISSENSLKIKPGLTLESFSSSVSDCSAVSAIFLINAP